MKSRISPVCLLSVIVLGLSVIPQNVQAQTHAPSRQKVVYEIYAGGIHAIQATLDIDIKPTNRYSLTLSAKTRGFLGSLAPWSGVFESHGWTLKDGTRRVQQHKSTTIWRGDAEIKDYAYGKDGTFKSITIDSPDQDPYTPDIDRAITQGTTDGLTATLKVLENYNAAQKCAGASDVFDGKNRFEQKFIHQKDVELEASKYNIYSGPAAECTIEITPGPGEWDTASRDWLSIQEQGQKKETAPTIWVASLDENAPAIPVKIRIKTAYGVMFMHLSEYQNGDEILIVEKRVADEDE